MKKLLLAPVLLAGSVAWACSHVAHDKHSHTHNVDCGHAAEWHVDHFDYDHDGHDHHQHAGGTHESSSNVH
ncbi:MAG: hypothetical protein V2I33_04320, partial [Kangiellaceae bacterium]|nr:hypothetical protein [Kangiellaceae bacterium]